MRSFEKQQLPCGTDDRSPCDKLNGCIEKTKNIALCQWKRMENLLLDWLSQVWQHDMIPGVGRRRTRRWPGGRGVTSNGGTFVQPSRSTGWRWCLFLPNCSSTSCRLTAHMRWRKKRWQLSDSKLIAALRKNKCKKGSVCSKNIDKTKN